MIVDAHQHFWDPARFDYEWMTDDVAALRRAYVPDDLRPVLATNGVERTVLVQATSSLDETRWLLELAGVSGFVHGVVGWVDLTRDVAAQLAGLTGPLVGVRHQVHDEPDAGWLLRDEVQRGIAAVGEAGLVFDLLVRARELPAAIETARRHPDVRFVLDHVAKPPLRTADLTDWVAGVVALAALPNTACKLSGLFTETEHRADVPRVVEDALGWFGPERCMFGSDWPVCLLAASYEETLAVIRDVAPEAVLGATALATYVSRTAP